MISSVFLNLSLDYAKSTWSESQSAPGLVFADCVELSVFGCKEYSQSNFNIDHLVMSMYKVISWVFVMTSVISWQNSVSLCPASFYTPRPNLPVTPGISWLLTFAFQIPHMIEIIWYLSFSFWLPLLGMLISAAAAAAKSLQLCSTLWNPIDSSPPGSPIPGILQARTLE